MLNRRLHMNLWKPDPSKMELWVDACSLRRSVNDGDPLNVDWEDLSGNNRNLTQLNADYKPAFSVDGFNGRPCVSFDGINDSLDFLDLNQNLGQECWLVVDTSQLSTGWRIFLQRSAIGTAFYLGSASENYTPMVYSYLQSSWGSPVIGQSIVGWLIGLDRRPGTKVNGYPEVTSSVLANITNVWTGVNSQGSQSSKIKVSEMLITQSGSSDETISKIEGYLAGKWGLRGNLPVDHPYKKFSPRN